MNNTGTKMVHWLADGKTFVMRGQSIHVDRIADLYSAVMDRAKHLLEKIIEHPAGDLMDLEQWKDNMEDESVDYSVFTDPDNRQSMQDLRFELYKKFIADASFCVGYRNGKPVWNEEKRSVFLKLCLELNRALMLLV